MELELELAVEPEDAVCDEADEVEVELNPTTTEVVYAVSVAVAVTVLPLPIELVVVVPDTLPVPVVDIAMEVEQGVSTNEYVTPSAAAQLSNIEIAAGRGVHSVRVGIGVVVREVDDGGNVVVMVVVFEYGDSVSRGAVAVFMLVFVQLFTCVVCSVGI